MDKIKKIAMLIKLANELDALGLTKEANFIDYLVAQVTSELKPIGEIYKENGKLYRKFMNPEKILVIKEVNPQGIPISPTPTAIEPTEPEPYFWERWWKEYNPWAGLNSGLGGQVEQADKEQEESKVPWIEKSKSTSK